MLRKTLVIVPLVSLLISGCGLNSQEQRESSGSDDYLQSPELKPLIVPNSMTVPSASNEYYVFNIAKQGEVGKDVDIRPPSLPLPTIADSYVFYRSGAIQLDAPDYAGFWSQIPTILRNNNIAISNSDSSTISTDVRVVNRLGESQPVEATYSLRNQLSSGREYVTVELTSLKRMGEDVTNPVERQYYTTEFFNMLMKGMASSSGQVSN